MVNIRYLYFLSFIEGASVMSTELMGAKLLAPYFGTSLYVWAAALGLTLGGLMSGYFLGGIASKRYSGNTNVLYYILVAAGFFLFIMPFTSKWIMGITLGMSLQMGAITSLLVFMTPPLLLMGMVSPLIIALLTEEAAEAGNSAGNVYAISTLGGILATFLLGFYIIPDFGIKNPALWNGFLLAIFPAISLAKRKIWSPAIVGAGMLVFLSVQVVQGAPEKPGLLYYSEGVLGQVKVIDFPFTNRNNQQRMGRALIVNNTLQTVMDTQDPNYDFWPYTKYIPDVADYLTDMDSVLLLGMGGGTMVKRMEEKQVTLDVVEIDERIRDAAVAHFGLSPTYDIKIDDARHYVQITDNTYDVIIYDTFKGESAPEHVITLEGIENTRDILQDEGAILINFYGYAEGILGEITRAIAKTLEVADFNVRIVATPGTPSTRNIMLIATQTPFPDSFDEQIITLGLNPLNLDYSNAPVLTDDAPQTRLYARTAAEWRKLYNAYYTREFSRY